MSAVLAVDNKAVDALAPIVVSMAVDGDHVNALLDTKTAESKLPTSGHHLRIPRYRHSNGTAVSDGYWAETTDDGGGM
jgi:hypothetical protein